MPGVSTAMVGLFKPQIKELVRSRDRYVADWELEHPDKDTYEDRDLEVTSFLDISVDDQISRIDRAVKG